MNPIFKAQNAWAAQQIKVVEISAGKGIADRDTLQTPAEKPSDMGFSVHNLRFHLRRYEYLTQVLELRLDEAHARWTHANAKLARFDVPAAKVKQERDLLYLKAQVARSNLKRVSMVADLLREEIGRRASLPRTAAEINSVKKGVMA